MDLVSVIYHISGNMEFLYPGIMGLLITMLFSIIVTKEIRRKYL